MKTLEEFKAGFPDEFNTLIRKFEDCPQKQSDHKNGYYIIADVWGTCFHRIATKKEKFEVKYIKNRTYTKIPKNALKNTYHCVVNFTTQAFELILPENERFKIVGIHEPTKHVSKAYFTQSFIVYSKADFKIKIIENPLLEGGLWVRNKNEELVRPASLLNKFDIHYIKPF